MFKRFCLIATAGLAVASSSAFAQTPSPELQQMQQQLEQVKAQLAELKAAQTKTDHSADVDATVERVIRESERRSQLMQLQGFTAGWTNERFVLQSEDGNFSLKPSLQFQLRHVINSSDGDGGQQTDHGFELRRMKFSFDGNAFSNKFTYFFLWNINSNTGTTFMEHAWVKYMIDDNWGVRGGQIGNPVFKEQALSSKRMLAVDRSLANSLVSDTGEAETQAVTVLYQKKPLYVEAGYTDGFASQNLDWRNTTAGNWGAFVRADYMLMGDIKQMTDYTAMGNKSDAMDLGGGLDITDGPDAMYYRHTADLQYKSGDKLGLMVGYLGNYQEQYAGGSAYDFGFVAQAGYMLSPKTEIFGRYSVSILDEAVAFANSSEDTFNEFTVGLNYYLHGHSAKFSIDLTYLPDGCPSDQKGVGAVRSDGDQFILRSQFQLLI